MFRFLLRYSIWFAIVWLIISCEKNIPPETGSLRIEFDNIAGNEDLILNEKTYVNAAGEEFSVSKFDYFVSNFVLFDNQGKSFTVPQDSSYFLIREDNRTSQTVSLNNIPVAQYAAMEFMIGVDSARSVSPIERRKGVLDPGSTPSHGEMYWSWNSGYIFVKLEGMSEVATSVNSKFYYHIGLFGGYDEPTVNNTRVVRIEFGPDRVDVTSSTTPSVGIFTDVLKIFDGPGTQLKIGEYNSIMGGQPEKAKDIANNYAHMFTYDHTF